MKKKLLAILLAVVMLVALSAPAYAVEFTDIDSHWAEDAIDRWVGHGIMNGVGGTEFAPNASMTRGQAAVMFAKLLKLETEADLSKYTDVNPDAWYAKYVAMCVEAGILYGVGDNAMNPDGELSREQMMVMLCRALGIQPEASCNKEFC